VRAFLDFEGIELPATYRYFNSSPDCIRCTAFLQHEGEGRMRYLREPHPRTHAIVVERLAKIRAAIDDELRVMEAAKHA